MIRLIGLAVSIGLADSLNPSTIAPALYFATGPDARRRVTEFTIAVFVIYLAGGVAIALGPGQLLLSLLPHPNADTRHVLEIVAGAALLIASLWLWRGRERLSKRPLPAANPEGRSGLLLGATITLLELPTAFPYFAVIAAIVGSGLDPARQILLLVLFNVCFVLPLLGIIATLAVAGNRADQILMRWRNFLQRNWPTLLSGLLFIAGIFVVLLGSTAFASAGHSRFGRLMRRLHRIIHP
jgi:cytochrome c biogenesis protein CcdA